MLRVSRSGRLLGETGMLGPYTYVESNYEVDIDTHMLRKKRNQSDEGKSEYCVIRPGASGARSA